MKMKRRLRLVLLAATFLAGCASTPTVFYTLDEGAPAASPRGSAPSIAVTQVSLPELIDRPQLVVRTAANRMRISEQQRWAEPLRREIARVIADDLGRLLDSSRVAALPLDAQRFDADFRLTLDVQRLEAVEGQGADVDILWRLEARQGNAIAGRSTLREPGAGDDAAALVAAQRRALARVAADVAGQARLAVRGSR